MILRPFIGLNKKPLQSGDLSGFNNLDIFVVNPMVQNSNLFVFDLRKLADLA